MPVASTTAFDAISSPLAVRVVQALLRVMEVTSALARIGSRKVSA